MQKIPFYEYIDIIDPRNKLEEIERRGKKEDRYSWCILIEEIIKYVIPNIFINDFISKINKNINFSNIYYETNNIYIDETMNKINEENQDMLFELQKLILLNSLDDKNFYSIQKNKLLQEMEIIYMLYIKKNEAKDENKISFLNNIFYKNIEIFEKRKGLIRLINKNNKDNITYEDYLIININNNEDIINCLNFIKHSTIIYKNVILPKDIKIKSENQYSNHFKINIKTTDLKIFNKLEKNIINDLKYNLHKSSILYIFEIYSNYRKTVNNNYYTFTRPGVLEFILLNNIYKYSHFFDSWRKKHKKY